MAKVRQNFWGQQAAAPRYSFTEHAAEMERLARRASWLGSDGAFVVHAPREGGRGEIWYYVARPTERALRRASKYGIPVGNLGPSEQVPYRAILSNLHFYRQPESRKVLVLDTFKGSVVGPLSYSQIAKKAGGSVNPRRNGNFEEEWKMRRPGEARKAHRARMRKSYGPDWWKEDHDPGPIVFGLSPTLHAAGKQGPLTAEARLQVKEWLDVIDYWKSQKPRPAWQTNVLRQLRGDKNPRDFSYFLAGAGLTTKPTRKARMYGDLPLVIPALREWKARGKPMVHEAWDAGVEFRGRGRQTGSPKNKTSEADWKRGDVAYYGESNTYYARRERMPTRPKGKKAWKVGRKSEWNGGDEYEWVHTKQEARDAFSELTSHRANPRRRTKGPQSITFLDGTTIRVGDTVTFMAPRGHPLSGTFKDATGVVKSFYKNWVYVKSPGVSGDIRLAGGMITSVGGVATDNPRRRR